MIKNRIPRKFNKIVGKMLINTSANKVNDVVYIYKDDYQGYRMYNTRTEKYYNPFVSMLRNGEIFELIEIQ